MNSTRGKRYFRRKWPTTCADRCVAIIEFSYRAFVLFAFGAAIYDFENAKWYFSERIIYFGVGKYISRRSRVARVRSYCITLLWKVALTNNSERRNEAICVKYLSLSLFEFLVKLKTSNIHRLVSPLVRNFVALSIISFAGWRIRFGIRIDFYKAKIL